MTSIGFSSTPRWPTIVALGATVLAVATALTAAMGGSPDADDQEVSRIAVVDTEPTVATRPASTASTLGETAEGQPAVLPTPAGPAGDDGSTSGIDMAPSTEDAPTGDTGGDVGAASPTIAAYPLGVRTLPTDRDGVVPPQTTPPALIDRRLTSPDVLPPPASGGFESTIEPLEGDPLARSTWTEGCPVGSDDLRYLTVSFWGFDDRPHQGELIVHQSAAADLVEVFRTLFEARFPIEEMRITTRAELDADPTGDGNDTSAFVCRAVTGGSRFSEHAYGLAIDINPFQNPYVKGDVVLPELASSYLDRSRGAPGIITEGDVVVEAFDAIGWGWGGRWQSLKDYQHFAANDR